MEYNRNGILITNSKSRDYFQLFLEKSNSLYSKLFIIFLESESIEIIHKNPRLIYIYLPLGVEKQQTGYNQTEKVANRIIDFLLVNRIFELNEECFVFFQNSKYSNFLNIISERLKPIVITFVDQLRCEGKLPDGSFLGCKSEFNYKGKLPITKIFNKDEYELLKKSTLILCKTQQYFELIRMVYQIQEVRLLSWYYSTYQIKNNYFITSAKKYLTGTTNVLVYYNHFKISEIHQILKSLSKISNLRIVLTGNIDFKGIPKDLATLSKVTIINGFLLYDIFSLGPDIVLLNKENLPTGDFMLNMVASSISGLIWDKSYKKSDNFSNAINSRLIELKEEPSRGLDDDAIINSLEQGQTGGLNRRDISNFSHSNMLKKLKNQLEYCKSLDYHEVISDK